MKQPKRLPFLFHQKFEEYQVAAGENFMVENDAINPGRTCFLHLGHLSELDMTGDAPGKPCEGGIREGTQRIRNKRFLVILVVVTNILITLEASKYTLSG